jgi:type VI secretion system protein ImpC
MEHSAFPFTILVVAPFTGRDAGKWTKGPIDVTMENLDQVVADLSLSVDITVPKEICREGILTFPIDGRRAFKPEQLLLANACLKNIFDARQFVREAPASGLGREEILKRLRSWENLPFLRIPDSAPRTEKESNSAVDAILSMVSIPEEKGGHSGERAGLAGQLEAPLRHVLELLFQDHEFKELEEAWDGLAFLLSRSGKGITQGNISVKILPASLQTFEETLDGVMFHMIRDIPSLIIVDLPLDSSSHGIALLKKLAELGETLLVPVLGWFEPRFFHMEAWGDLQKLPYLPHHLERPEFAKWQKLRESTAGKWLGMACNRFLARYPYGRDYQKGPVFFEEPVIPWRSPVWAIGTLICQSHMATGWPSRFGEWKKFNLEDLAVQNSGADNYYATEVAFDEDRIGQMIASGLIPLVSFKNKDMAFVAGESTVSGTSLAFQLVLSRIIQFAIWCKERFGKKVSASDLRVKLESALSRFWEETGHMPPEDMHISVKEDDAGDPTSVEMMIKPPPAILPSREVIEFHFDW